jgi:hypothetical protein
MHGCENIGLKVKSESSNIIVECEDILLCILCIECL